MGVGWMLGGWWEGGVWLVGGWLPIGENREPLGGSLQLIKGSHSLNIVGGSLQLNKGSH